MKKPAGEAMAAKDSDEPKSAAGGLTTKKLILIVGVALAVLLAGIGTAVFVVSKRAAAEAAAEADSDEDQAAAEAARRKAERAKRPPVFVPLDPFVVNLTDREQDRYAQIGIILEIDDAKFGDQLKTYMPAIRNGILMILAHKSSLELLQREGKEVLAEEIMQEAVRPMALEEEADNPIRAVHYSSFIIQ
jgi:flagellar FliL protein